MSNDMISRKGAIESVKRIIQAGLPEEAIYAELEEIPTAYDVDLICNDMAEIGKRYCDSVKCDHECKYCDHGVLMNVLVKTVRNGGKK